MKKLASLIITIAYSLSLELVGVNLAELVRPAAAAADAPSTANQVIINEVKLGGSSNPSVPTEYVTVFNGGNATVSLDGWKLEYAKPGAAVDCGSSNWGVPTSQITELSGTLAPNQLSAAIARSFTDNKDGSLHLVDSNGTIQDLVGWGATAPCSEASPAQTPANDKSIQRYLECANSFPVDTDNNANDFAAPNTPNPTGLSNQYDTTCPTGTNPTPTSPGGDNGDNAGGGATAGPTCEGILINELLPNPSGTDVSHEFIELHNPTSTAISLDGCSLQTTANSKTYNFSGVTLQSGEYHAFYDSQTGLSLPNSAGGTVWLLSPTEELQAITYPENLGDEVAWAHFGNAWQATYTATPNAANVLTTEKPCPTGQYRDTQTDHCRDIVSAATLVPCKSGQERNSATNRCRSTLASGTTLQPCKPGQIRNPATNRCKSTAASSLSLKPCKTGEERNPETNRCRKIGASGSTLKPCQSGWQRNPTTNRCRKAAAANIANVQDIKSTVGSGNTRWRWVVATAIIISALAYALYEWRQEVMLRYADVKVRAATLIPRKR